MQAIVNRFVKEEEGAQTVEYALVLGLVALAAIAGITLVGNGLATWWNSLGSYIGGLQQA